MSRKRYCDYKDIQSLSPALL